MLKTTTAAPKSQIAQTFPEFVIVESATGAVVGTIVANNAVEAFLAARRDTHLPQGIRVRKMPTDADEVAAIRTAVAAFEQESQQEPATMPKVKTAPVPVPTPKIAGVATSFAKAAAAPKVATKAVVVPVIETVRQGSPAPVRIRAKKEGLRKPQIKILKALLASKGPLSRRRIAEAISADPTRITDVWDPIGTTTEEDQPAQDERLGYRSLMSLKFLRRKELELDGHKEVVFELTPAGRKAAEKASI